MKTNTNARVQKHRDGLRRAGLRPVQIWVPDTRLPNFAAECEKQCEVANAAEDTQLDAFLEQSATDTEGWTP